MDPVLSREPSLPLLKPCYDRKLFLKQICCVQINFLTLQSDPIAKCRDKKTCSLLDIIFNKKYQFYNFCFAEKLIYIISFI